MTFTAGGCQAVNGEGADDHLFEIAQVGMEIFAVREREDWVAYDLTGSVIGDVAPSVRFEDSDALPGTLGFCPE